MLIHFFKNLFPFKPKEKDIDPLSYYYKKMELLNSKYKDENVAKSYIYGLAKTISEDLVNSCLERAIKDNNLLLVKILHPYLNLDASLEKIKQNNEKDVHNNLFNYAIIAVENKNTEIFNYLIQYHCKYNNGKAYPYNQGSVQNFHYLMQSIFKEENNEHIECFHILKKSRVFNSSTYLGQLINTGSKPDDIDNKLNFIMKHAFNKNENCYYYLSSSEQSYILFQSVCNFIRTENYSNPKYTNSCINIMSRLLNLHASFYLGEEQNKLEIGGKEFFDMITYLIENDPDKKLNINLIATNCAQMKDNFKLIEYFLKKGATINHNLPNIEPEVHEIIKKWNDAKTLHNQLHRELSIKSNEVRIKKVNKV